VLALGIRALVEVRGQPDPEHPALLDSAALSGALASCCAAAPASRCGQRQRPRQREHPDVASHRLPPLSLGQMIEASDEASCFLVTAYAYLRARGSRASRSPSPTRLKASVVANRKSPGKTIIHQATVKIDPASESILPQDGVVGGTPMPRKESAASNRMLFGMIRVVNTSTGAKTFGSTSRVMIRRSLAPAARAASTNSFSRRRRTSPRTNREM